MKQVTCTPIVNGQDRQDLAHTVESDMPTVGGVIIRAVHVAQYNLNKAGIATSCPNVSFDLKFE